MNDSLRHTIYPLGDRALVIDYGNLIDDSINQKVLQVFNALKDEPLPGMIEAVPAYSSVTVHYDPFLTMQDSTQRTAFDFFRQQIERRLQHMPTIEAVKERNVRIPVCYELGVDLDHMASVKNISIAEIIQIHSSRTYRVYMIGFLPGFPYMGTVDEKIAMPRKEKPGLVKAGSVGIAGVQTGIYPFDSPGGWQIIGRTPLKLFHADNVQPAFLQPGDRVRFYSITKDEFENYQGGNT